MCLVYFLMIPRTYTLKEQQLVSIFFFGNPAVCEIDPQEVNLTLSVYLMGLQIPETAGLQKKTCL